jgi:hypothetical protein
MMSAETAFFLLKVAGALLTLAIAIIGFFIKMLISSVEKIRELVTILKTITDERSNQEVYKHSIIDNKLNSLDKSVQLHEIRLNTIETKLNID